MAELNDRDLSQVNGGAGLHFHISKMDYTVMLGDTWDAIAARFGCSVQELLEMNKANGAIQPRAGDVIWVPDYSAFNS